MAALDRPGRSRCDLCVYVWFGWVGSVEISGFGCGVCLAGAAGVRKCYCDCNMIADPFGEG